MARSLVVGFTDTCTGILRSKCSCLISDIFTCFVILHSAPVSRKNTKERRRTHRQYSYMCTYALPELPSNKGSIIIKQNLKINVFHIQRTPSLPSLKVRHWLQFPFHTIIFCSVLCELVEDGAASGFVFIREENQQQSWGSS